MVIDKPLIILCDALLGPPALYGLEQLIQSLQSRQITVERVHESSLIKKSECEHVIIVGCSKSSEILRQMEREGLLNLPVKPESLMVKKLRWFDKMVLVIAGADDRGVMYATLDIAQRIQWKESSEDPFTNIEEIVEEPELEVRSVCMFVTNAALEKEWYFSEQFWQDYFGMLAQDRFNSFTIITGTIPSGGPMTPPYPFLLEVEEYPEVRVSELSDEERNKNLKMLQYISKLAKDRGIDFWLGIWSHRARSHDRSRDKLHYGIAEGLTDENLKDYCYRGLKKLLTICPDIVGVQLRINTESGIALNEQLDFWTEIFRAMHDCGRPVKVDLRAKGLTDELIQRAVDFGLELRVSTKYWGEHMGLPYHPTKIQLLDQHNLCRYSYDRLLYYPRPYRILYQLWNVGSQRIFLWGDPDYVKRFVSSCHLGDGLGFEVMAPLSHKGLSGGSEVWHVLEPNYRYYRWEQERYWFFYLLFGRLGYNPNTSPSVWMTEFIKRFGAEAAPYVEEAYRKASWVIPWIIAYNMYSASVFGFWAEKDTGGTLDFYIQSEPSDVAMFYSILEYVDDYLKGKDSAKMKPRQVSELLKNLSYDIMEAINRAVQFVDAEKNKEFLATKIDLEVRAALARYHASKILAGEQLAFFYATGDYSALKRAQGYAKEALSTWEHIAKITNGVYHDNMVFGPRGQDGHWKDNIVFVRHDLARLEEVERLFLRYGIFDIGFDFGENPGREGLFMPITRNYSVERRFKGTYPDTIYTCDRGYGWDQTGGALTARPAPKVIFNERGVSTLKALNTTDLNLLSDMLYADFIFCPAEKMELPYADFLVDLPNGIYELTMIMKDCSEASRDHGPMWFLVQGNNKIGPFKVSAGQLVEKKIRAEVVGGRLSVSIGASLDSLDWLINGLVITACTPHIGHVPIRKAAPNKDLSMEAAVTGPDPIENVTLYYKNAKDAEYASLSMLRRERCLYHVAIPAAVSVGKLYYYIEAVDRAEHKTEFPRNGKEDPLTILISTDDNPPEIMHQPALSCKPEEPLVIRAQIVDDSPLRSVKLHYRNVNQREDFRTIEMGHVDGDFYQAIIHGRHITSEWDIMYYIEAVDEFGNGAFFPNLDRETPYVVVKVQHKVRKFPPIHSPLQLPMQQPPLR